MALFRIQKQHAIQIMPLGSHPEKEKGLQKLFEASLEQLFGVRFVATEFSTGQKHRGRIDTLGLDQDGSPVIIEYKLKANENVINQGLFYLDWLMDHKGDFELATTAAIPGAEVVWSSPRLILLAGSFSRYDQYAVNRIDERIELWTYTIYDEDLLAVDLLSSDEAPTIKDQPQSKKSATNNPKFSNTSKPAYSLEHHQKTMSSKTEQLFDQLRTEILELGDDITERFMKQYVGYRRQKNFCEIVGKKEKLNVFIDGPVSDDDGLCDDMSTTGHWGTGNLRVNLSTEDDIASVMPLIAQAYDLQK